MGKQRKRAFLAGQKPYNPSPQPPGAMSLIKNPPGGPLKTIAKTNGSAKESTKDWQRPNRWSGHSYDFHMISRESPKSMKNKGNEHSWPARNRMIPDFPFSVLGVFGFRLSNEIVTEQKPRKTETRRF